MRSKKTRKRENKIENGCNKFNFGEYIKIEFVSTKFNFGEYIDGEFCFVWHLI